MKNKYSLLMLLALVVSGCGSTTTSSTNNSNSSINNQTSSSEISSSKVSSSSTSSSSISSSTSSSSTGIDKTGWIEENDEAYAINNPKKWFYNFDEASISVTNAMYFDDDKVLYFDFNGEGSFDSVNLYYHDTYVLVGESYTTKFSYTSNVAGKITVNGVEKEVRIGTQEISVDSELKEGNAVIDIQFGTNSTGLISNNVAIEIGDVYLTKVTNVKARLEHAIELNNYTITLKEDTDSFNGNGYYGEAKFFEKACVYTYGNSYDSTSGNKGYAENETGIFGFKLDAEGNVNANTYYEIDSNDNTLKGLYSTNEKIHLKEYEGDKNGDVCEGIPSLHKLDLAQFDFDILIGESITVKNASSLRYLAYMIDDYFCTFYYSGISAAKVTLNADDNLEISFNNTYKSSKATFVISNIGTTSNDKIEEFIGSENFAPKEEVEEAPIDPNVESIVNKIALGNYTILKEDGTKFYMNSKYSYLEKKNSETNEIEVSGYLVCGPSIFRYEIKDGSIIVDSSLDYAGLFLGQIAVNGLDGLNSGNVQFFLMNKANKYTFNEEKSWYEYKDTSDASYVSFASKWFDLSPVGFNYVSIKEANNEITIGMEMKFDDNETVYKSIQVTNIGNTSVTMLDEYLASLEEVTE